MHHHIAAGHAREGGHNQDDDPGAELGCPLHKLVRQRVVLPKGRVQPNHQIVAFRQLPCSKLKQIQVQIQALKNVSQSFCI